MGKYHQYGLRLFWVCVVNSCKCPLFEIPFDEELRQIDQAAMIERDPPQNATIVARKRPIRGHGFSAEVPLTPLAALGVHQTSVPRQIILGLRMAVGREPVRTCVETMARLVNLPRDAGWWRIAADADRQDNAFFDNVAKVVAQNQISSQTGITVQKLSH